MDLKPLITLLAIVNPLAIVPFFIHYTQGFSPVQRKQTIYTAAFSAFCVIAVCAILGLQILEFFNISLPSFQVGGALLLLISALNMLNAQPAEAKPLTNELEAGAEKAAAGSSIAVVPLTIPLLTGPRPNPVAASRADWLRRGDWLGHGAVLLAGRPDSARTGQNRYQRAHPLDGTDTRRTVGRGDGRWAGQIVSAAGALNTAPFTVTA